MNLDQDDPDFKGRIFVAFPLLGFGNVIQIRDFDSNVPCQIHPSKDDVKNINEFLALTEYNEDELLLVQRWEAAYAFYSVKSSMSSWVGEWHTFGPLVFLT